VNVPIALTLGRIVAIPVVMGLILLEDDLSHNFGIAAAVFTVAALSDFADGWLARRWDQTSILGAFLDLTADKLLVTGTLAALLVVDRVNIWPAFIIIAREISIMAIRGVVANAGKMVPASQWGKWKATVQFVAIGLAIVRLEDKWGPLYLDEWAIWIAVAITVISAVGYIVKFRSILFTSD
jgi:CDP-diacylglycerol--glycerol-3-phosphate 3-phosphatidyltransferase